MSPLWVHAANQRRMAHDIDGSRRHEMLKMCALVAYITCIACTTGTSCLGNRALNTGPNLVGSGELFGLHALSARQKRFMLSLGSHGNGPPRWGSAVHRLRLGQGWQSVVPNLILMTWFLKWSMAGLQLVLVLPMGQVARCCSQSMVKSAAA